jgi:5-methyltetrahydrofolate--homocysteine methyltransferase
MIIIAEKINGSIPSCSKAIAGRDVEYIKDLAKRQADAGADFIDCCASVKENERQTLEWMINAIQSVTDLPISIDSPDVSAIIDSMPLCNRPGLFNSVSGEGNKIDLAFPVLARPMYSKWQVMALLCDDSGIPKSAAGRIAVFERIMTEAAKFGIDDKRIHIDPLVEMLCTTDDGEGISLILEVINHIKSTRPNVHVSGAISNVSYNLPVRRLVNQTFTVLAMSAGMSSVILDPLSKDLRGMIYAAEAMLGLDDFCAEYISAYRSGIFS